MKIKVSDLVEFDIDHHLKNKRAVTEYLNQVLSEGDDAELAIARAKVFVTTYGASFNN